MPIWFNQGQVCCGFAATGAGRRGEAFIDKLKRRMDTLRVGPSLDRASIGAIVDTVQLERIRALVERGVEEGCEIHQTKGLRMPEQGAFYPPTLVTNVAPASTLAQEEIFGPCCEMSFRNPTKPVALANHSRYGLAASVWSETIGARWISPRVCNAVWSGITRPISSMQASASADIANRASAARRTRGDLRVSGAACVD